MNKYFLVLWLCCLCKAQSDKINYIYYNGYFYDEAPSIVKVNIDSNEEDFSNQQFDLIYPSAFLFDVSDDQSKILLSPFNDGELIMDFSELGPLVLYDYISKDTLSSGALNARFTYNSDKIIFMQIDSILPNINPGGDGYLSSIYSYSIDNQESTLISDSIPGLEYYISHDKTKLLFIDENPTTEIGDIIIYDLILDEPDTLNWNFGYPPRYGSRTNNYFYWAEDDNLYFPEIYNFENNQDSILKIYKLDISENPSSPEVYHSFEGFIGGSILPYSDHSANKFIITGTQVGDDHGGMFSFDVNTGQLDFLHYWSDFYRYPIINTFTSDGSRYILGMFGFMGLNLTPYIFDLTLGDWGSINYSNPYIGRNLWFQRTNIFAREVDSDSVLSNFKLTYPNSSDTLYFSQTSVNDSTTFTWEESVGLPANNVDYTYSLWYSEFSDVIGYTRNILFEDNIDTNKITIPNELIVEIYEDAYLQPDFASFGWSVRASNGVNMGHDKWSHAFLGLTTGYFQAQSKGELVDAVNLWVSDNSSAISLYGHINTWDVSYVTDMQGLFENFTNFNDLITNWDVSSVTDMSKMFAGAENFNKNISNWDVSNVTNMNQMFFNADSFDQDISFWNVSNVDSMEHIFNMITNNVSHENRCAIHNSWINRTDAWVYNWSIFCQLSNQSNSITPKFFKLHQNYPNPFNPTTQIHYDLANNEFVSINIYNVMGYRIKSLISTNQDAGYKSVYWNATNDLGHPVSAGVYIYTIQAGEFRQTRKMVLLN